MTRRARAPGEKAPLRRGLAFGAVALVGALALAAATAPGAAPPDEIEWGATFSQKMCASLGIDWRETYLAVVGDLRPSVLRLVAYWDLVEPAPGRYDFADLDWQVGTAEAAGIPVVIAVGQKVPRWPEYHFPRWLRIPDERERRRRLLAYLAVVVERYRGRPGLRYWQVENEPFLDFGDGPRADPAFLGREVELVRGLDPRHPVLVTDSGEWGSWLAAARAGDVFGTTLYRKVHDPRLGTFSYPLVPGYYALRERVTKLATGKPGQRFICAELGAEPWGAEPVPRMSSAEQRELFSPEAFRRTVAFARGTGLRELYFWGVEWWYFRKLRGDPAYWDEARRVIRSGRRQRAGP